MRPRLLLALSMAIVASCGSACGGDSERPKSDQDRVRAAAQEFASSFVNGDYEKACSLMTAGAKAQLLESQRFLKSNDCEDATKKVAAYLSKADFERVRSYRIDSITIRGSVAEVDDNTRGSPTELRKVGGRWLVDRDGT
jgi:hypothetical protein